MLNYQRVHAGDVWLMLLEDVWRQVAGHFSHIQNCSETSQECHGNLVFLQSNHVAFFGTPTDPQGKIRQSYIIHRRSPTRTLRRSWSRPSTGSSWQLLKPASLERNCWRNPSPIPSCCSWHRCPTAPVELGRRRWNPCFWNSWSHGFTTRPVL